MNKTIIFILSHWHGGGVERVFCDVAKVFENDEKTKIYLFVCYGYNSKNLVAPENVKVLQNFRQCKKIKKQNKNAIIVNFSGFWISGLLSRFLSRSYISWIHGNPFTAKTAKTAFLNFYLLRHSKLVVTVCNEQREILIKNFGFKNKVITIYNCVDFEKIKNLMNVPLENVSFKYFLMVARMDLGSKDFFTLIDAYDLLPQKIKAEFRLVLLGDGKDFQKVRDYADEKSLSENVIMPGFEKNPYRWMKNASCTILSSTNEGFSVSALETLFCGSPQILTHYHTGAEEVSDNGKNCVLVEIGDAKAMSLAMQKIVCDEVFANSLVKNAFEYAKNFSFEIFQKKIKEVFENLL